MSASLRGARKPHPTLKVRVTRHPDADRIRGLTLVLPKQLRLSRAAAKRQASAVVSEKLARSSFDVRGKRRLVVRGLPKKGVSTLSLRLQRGAVRLTRSAARKARHGRKLKLSFKVRSVETDGDAFTSKASARAKN